MPPKSFWRDNLWIFRSIPKGFWKFWFLAKWRPLLCWAGLIFGPKSKIFTFSIFYSVPKLERLGALEKPKIGHVIDKIGLSKRYAIFEFFIFPPALADFWANFCNFRLFLAKIGPYGPKNKKIKNRRITSIKSNFFNNMTHFGLFKVLPIFLIWVRSKKSTRLSIKVAAILLKIKIFKIPLVYF